MRTSLATAAVVALLRLPAGTLAAQDHHPEPHRHQVPQAGGAPRAEPVERPLGIPMSRMGSGTAWLPDAARMRAYHFAPDGWLLMVHGDADLYYDHQGTPRGADQVGSTNWFMLMAMHPLGRGLLHLHGMASAEPLTVGARGYPLLLQTGESYRGVPLRDRQHPHDLFMELSAMYEFPLTRRLGLSFYAAPVGEPGIGPVAYMHRPSAQSDPFAPLGHHWQDATHITYGVLTAGVFTRTVRLEGTLFHGREPDEDRYDFDFGALDSYGGRITVNPSPGWSLAASYGYLKSPEALHPEENQHRIGASVLYAGGLGQGHWAAALVYGANRHTGPGASGGFEHSLLLEANAELGSRNSVFGRLEWVQKSAEELVVPGFPADARFDVGGLVLGYLREVARYAGAGLDLGVRGSLDVVPAGLEPTYGTRTPAGLALYLRVRPLALGAHPGMSHEAAAGEGGMHER